MYSGRSEELVAPLIEQFEDGKRHRRRGAVRRHRRTRRHDPRRGRQLPCRRLLRPGPCLTRRGSSGRSVHDARHRRSPISSPARFADDAGRWVGISGRARSVVYDTTKIDPAEPAGHRGRLRPTRSGGAGSPSLRPTDRSWPLSPPRSWSTVKQPRWRGSRAWPPTRHRPTRPTRRSSPPSTTARSRPDSSTTTTCSAASPRKAPVVAANHFFSGSAGSLVMPAGIGILNADGEGAAAAFVRFLLSAESQPYFANETFEYPLVAGIAANPDLPHTRLAADTGVEPERPGRSPRPGHRSGC